MAKVFIQESTLTAIGDAIRSKTGKTELIDPANMSTEIASITTGGGGLPEEALNITGDCSYRFANNGWNWFIEEYGNQITTSITNGACMFQSSSRLTNIPFNINISGGMYYGSMFSSCTQLTSVPSLTFTGGNTDVNQLFYNCNNLTSIGKLSNIKFAYNGPRDMFCRCYNLRYLPAFENIDYSWLHTYSSANCSEMFFYCYSLRNIDESLLNNLYNNVTGSYASFYLNTFSNCFVLDELKGVHPTPATITSNFFSNTFTKCSRLKNMIFETQADGTPYTVNWKAQTIDLSNYVGYANSLNNITDHNSGITADKQVTDDVTYQALKNDPDWFTIDIAYSRYNHDSAVATINSLPDTSAYLATAGGTNTIKFNGASGSATDGGAINTLTEEEIAVATAKGWTVTLV